MQIGKGQRALQGPHRKCGQRQPAGSPAGGRVWWWRWCPGGWWWSASAWFQLGDRGAFGGKWKTGRAPTHDSIRIRECPNPGSDMSVSDGTHLSSKQALVFFLLFPMSSAPATSNVVTRRARTTSSLSAGLHQRAPSLSLWTGSRSPRLRGVAFLVIEAAGWGSGYDNDALSGSMPIPHRAG